MSVNDLRFWLGAASFAMIGVGFMFFFATPVARHGLWLYFAAGLAFTILLLATLFMDEEKAL